jgi:hypothetical protein
VIHAFQGLRGLLQGHTSRKGNQGLHKLQSYSVPVVSKTVRWVLFGGQHIKLACTQCAMPWVRVASPAICGTLGATMGFGCLPVGASMLHAARATSLSHRHEHVAVSLSVHAWVVAFVTRSQWVGVPDTCGCGVPLKGTAPPLAIS